MKYSIDFGHNSPTKDTGANGYRFEDDLVREVGKLLVEKLKNDGNEVILTQPPKSSSSVNASLNYRCEVANSSNADIFVSLHFNSFTPSANGTEVWVASENSKVYKEAELVVQNIAKLGFTNRGVKCGNFRVLTGTCMPAMLIEGCFVSSKKDMNLFNAETMATAIFKGLKGNKVKQVPEVETHKENAKLKVTHKTLLKPSTKQSNQIDSNLLKTIDIGEYDINLLADEEDHYLITFDKPELFGIYKFFIFSEHCELIHV